MRSIVAILFILLSLLACRSKDESNLSGERKRSPNTSERSDMIDRLIIEEAAMRGVNGDSIRIDYDSPRSVEMCFYEVHGGSRKIVQKSVPTRPSSSFEVGYMFEPASEGKGIVRFLYYDHDHPTKGLGSNLALVDNKQYVIIESYRYRESRMSIPNVDGEAVVYFATNKTNFKSPADSSIDHYSQSIEDGLVMTIIVRSQP